MPDDIGRQPTMFKKSALATLVLFFAPIAISLVMAFLVPSAIKYPIGYEGAALICYGIGFLSFAAAKIQSIRKEHVVSFGSSLMSAPQKWAYRIGYALM